MLSHMVSTSNRLEPPVECFRFAASESDTVCSPALRFQHGSLNCSIIRHILRTDLLSSLTCSRCWAGWPNLLKYHPRVQTWRMWFRSHAGTGKCSTICALLSYLHVRFMNSRGLRTFQLVDCRGITPVEKSEEMERPAPGADYAALREQYASQKQEELEAEEGGFVAVRNYSSSTL
jgi:hypothetical protein